MVINSSPKPRMIARTVDPTVARVGSAYTLRCPSSSPTARSGTTPPNIVAPATSAVVGYLKSVAGTCRAQRDGAVVRRRQDVTFDLHLVAQSEVGCRFAEEPHTLGEVQRTLQPGRVAQGGDHEGRRVHPAVKEQGVAHAANRAG